MAFLFHGILIKLVTIYSFSTLSYAVRLNKENQNLKMYHIQYRMAKKYPPAGRKPK
jgi:hypothetical protein